jgi:hypothetical protein
MSWAEAQTMPPTNRGVEATLCGFEIRSWPATTAALAAKQSRGEALGETPARELRDAFMRGAAGDQTDQQ